MNITSDFMSVVDDAIHQVREQGCYVLDGVIPEEKCEEIRQGIYDAARSHRRDYASDGVTFCPTIINHNQSFAEYITDTRLMAIIEGLLGPHARISYTSALINEPENPRGEWHADWPFNAQRAGHLPSPYPVDVIFHITTLWMISPFNEETSGTFYIPGSHKRSSNPTGGPEESWTKPIEGEMNVTGSTGSVLIFDARLWHAVSVNHSDKPRVAVGIRFAPWWLNLDILMPGSEERKMMADELGLKENEVPRLNWKIYDNLPNEVKPLYRHWLHDR